MLPLLRPSPDLRERVWGGSRLGPPRRLPIGEAWLAGPASVVADGPDAGRSLDQLAAREGAALVGRQAVVRTGDRFPLLVKLIDPQEWLSVQVHPDDETARRLEGPDAIGKTEAWLVLDAAPGAELLIGVREGVTEAEVRAAIGAAAAGGEPHVAPLLNRATPVAGDAYLLPAGTLHAIGPGVLVYEIQQPSDITYRCEDWGRPSTPERPIHTARALASLAVERQPVWVSSSGERRSVSVTSPQFVLERLRLEPGEIVSLEPAGESLHVVTALDQIVVAGSDGSRSAVVLRARETVVVPAAWPDYTISASVPASVLIARIP